MSCGATALRMPPSRMGIHLDTPRKAEKDIIPLSDDGFCVTILRQATVYGLSPRMRFDLAINGMVKGFITKGTIPILRDGSQWRPFVHVKDTTRAMKLILETPSTIVNNQIFNVGSDDQNIQIISLAKTVAKSMKLPFKCLTDPSF